MHPLYIINRVDHCNTEFKTMQFQPEKSHFHADKKLHHIMSNHSRPEDSSVHILVAIYRTTRNYR